MKNTIKTWSFYLLIIGVLIIIGSCKKDKDTADNSSNNTTTANIPVLITKITTNISTYSATTGGSISSDGGSPVITRGICISTTATTPTINDSIIPNGSGTGGFTINLTNLTMNTKYYVRAYATNSNGTGYGSIKNFTTLKVLATLTTSSVSNILKNSATCGGNISTDGGAPVIARGVCWNTDSLPTIDSCSFTTDSMGIGTFTSNITNLIPNTLYYVRAYATTSSGTSYGNQVSFTTPGDSPALTTTTVGSITQTTAVSGGTITNDYDSPITIKGVCWSTSQNPTINNNKTDDGTGTASFVSNLTGLTGTTTYYVRAYATNSFGTGYGNEISFTTTSQAPILTTAAINSISETSAYSGGTITNNYNSTITAKGVCWSTSQNPTTNNNLSSDGTGTSSFISNITGLTGGTTYYVRAYAINSFGTGYGNELSFTTLPPHICGTPITDDEGNSYNTVSIGTKCWMKENLNIGTMITNTSSVEQTNNNTIEKFCYNNIASNCTTYGGLYQWGEMVKYYSGASNLTTFNPPLTGNLRGICPLGWHIPNNFEWNNLFKVFDASFNYNLNPTSLTAGGKFKETGTNHWNSPNTGADNASGFTALGGGSSDGSGTFNSLKTEGYYASLYDFGFYGCYSILFNNNSSSGYFITSIKANSVSVRCLKD